MATGWKTINTQAEFRRYSNQPGVNVFGIKEAFVDAQECIDIENSLYKAFQQQAQNNQIRFYRTDNKLSDGGGGLQVWFNGRKVEHKGLLPGSLNPVGDAIKTVLAK